MRPLILSFLVVALGLSALPARAHAQCGSFGCQPTGNSSSQSTGGGSRARGTYASSADVGAVVGCIEAFYDRDNYGWYAFHNGCNVPVNVHFNCKLRGNGCWGSTTVRPGRTESTSLSAREIEEGGGLRYHICPPGFIATDMTGEVQTYLGSSYLCKQQ